MKLSAREIKKFQKTIVDHYKKSGRVFPWRKTRDPYAILVSEGMLQQTQAERVVPFFRAWMKQFPTAQALAKAPVGAVLKSWQGLGYNRRALNLKRAGEMVVKEYGGVIPKDLQKIDTLPGVGPYTAGAIGAFAFNISSAFIETNIRTVYLLFFFKGRMNVADEEILEVVKQTLPNEVQPLPRFEVKPRSVRLWYSALMDYGAMLKSTVGNPNIWSKEYTKQSAFKGSRRELRGAILRQASQTDGVSVKDIENRRSKFDIKKIFTQLVTEGFLKKSGKTFRLA